MALRQTQQLRLQQKLSPQQIQLMKMIQLPVMALEQRIKEEIETNPALEEENNEEETTDDFNDDLEAPVGDDLEKNEEEENEAPIQHDEVSYEDFVDEDEYADYKYQVNNQGKDNDFKESPLREVTDFHDQLEEQLGLLELNEKQYTIGLYLIGCIDDDGYIRRDSGSLVDDLAFTQNINATETEVEELIKVLQKLDPPGIAARSLQECLLLQLERNPHHTREVHYAMDVVKKCMDEFSKKHYDKIAAALELNESDLKDILAEIIKLNPKPGSASAQAGQNIQEVIPDFVITTNEGELELSLNSRNMPELKISKEYMEMLTRYNLAKDKTSKEASGFIKNKIENAQWFIDALMQRQRTLLICMNTIMKFQKEYFLSREGGFE